MVETMNAVQGLLINTMEQGDADAMTILSI